MPRKPPSMFSQEVRDAAQQPPVSPWRAVTLAACLISAMIVIGVATYILR